MWALDLEQPGRMIERPTVSADGDCYLDSAEGVVVAPYVVSGRNDGEVWLRVEASVGGPGGADIVGAGAMNAPDGRYTMHGDVEVSLEEAEGSLPEPLSCRLTARRWK